MCVDAHALFASLHACCAWACCMEPCFVCCITAHECVRAHHALGDLSAMGSCCMRMAGWHPHAWPPPPPPGLLPASQVLEAAECILQSLHSHVPHSTLPLCLALGRCHVSTHAMLMAQLGCHGCVRRLAPRCGKTLCDASGTVLSIWQLCYCATAPVAGVDGPHAMCTRACMHHLSMCAQDTCVCMRAGLLVRTAGLLTSRLHQIECCSSPPVAERSYARCLPSTAFIGA